MKKTKKIIAFVCALMFAIAMIPFTLAGCGGLTVRDGKTVIRVNEVTHSIFYAPFYVAMGNGYFEDENIVIELTNGGGSDKSMAALTSGNAEIALLGPETIVYVSGGGAKDHPVMFGQLTKRDGSLLVGRNAEPDFDWNNLKGKEVIAGRRGGSPAMNLQYAIEQVKGLEIGTGEDQVNFNLDVAFNMVVPTFESGQGDYCTMFEPLASDFVAAGKGHIVAAVGEVAGEVPFTGFAAKKSFLRDNEDVAEAFLRAIIRAVDFLKDPTTTMDEIVASLRGQFPASSTTEANIISSINTYVAIDAWKDSPLMNPSDFERLQDIMDHAGELTNRVAINKIIDNSIAVKFLNT